MPNLTPMVPQRKIIQKLSEDELRHIARFLSPKDTGRLAQTNYFLSEITQENTVWQDKLTPEARERIDPQDPQSALTLFRDVEENRLPQYRSVAYFRTNRETRNLFLPLYAIKCIKDGRLPFDIALKLTFDQSSNLSSTAVQKYLENGKLPFDTALNLTLAQNVNLSSTAVQKCLENGTLSFDTALKLTLDQSVNLSSTAVQKYIKNGRLNFDTALNLTLDQSSKLSSTAVQKYIDNGKLPLDTALNLTLVQFINLCSTAVQRRIDNGSLSMEKVLHLFRPEDAQKKGCTIS